MGYWLYLEVDTGAGNHVDVFEANFTRNLTPMWHEALGWHLRDFDGAPAVEAAGPLEVGVQVMEADPVRFEGLNPANGWGDAFGALALLRDLRDACKAHPAAVIRVSG